MVARAGALNVVDNIGSIASCNWKQGSSNTQSGVSMNSGRVSELAELQFHAAPWHARMCLWCVGVCVCVRVCARACMCVCMNLFFLQ
jgi:hypothetical protein